MSLLIRTLITISKSIIDNICIYVINTEIKNDNEIFVAILNYGMTIKFLLLYCLLVFVAIAQTGSKIPTSANFFL